MTRAPEDELNREIWWMLCRLKKEQLLLPDGGLIEWNGFSPNRDDMDFPNGEDQWKILSKLKEKKVLNIESKSIYSPGEHSKGIPPHMIQYWVISINKEKFKEEYAYFEKIISAQEGSIKASDERPIKKLTLVESNVGKSYKIVINDDYKNNILVSGTRTWNLLFQLGKKELVEANGRKSALDYLNTNNRCKLYARTGYSLTKILGIDDGDIKSNIEIDVISEKALETRKNQLKKDLS